MDPASPSNSVVTGSVEDSSGEEDSDDDNDLPNAEQGGIQHNGNEAQEEEEEDNDEVRKRGTSFAGQQAAMFLHPGMYIVL